MTGARRRSPDARCTLRNMPDARLGPMARDERQTPDRGRLIRMGRLIYSMSVSLDRFVETPDRSLDWVLVVRVPPTR